MEKEPDEYCRKIFMVLSLDNKKTRFNELHRKLIKYDAKMSKPTLIEHLNHLIKDKVIQRKQQDKQKVFYEVNWKKFEQLQERHTCQPRHIQPYTKRGKIQIIKPARPNRLHFSHIRYKPTILPQNMHR